MTSEVGICNLALSHIGQGAISSLEENSVEAELCRLTYPVSRDAVLRENAWNFAARRVALGRLAENPPVGWQYMYSYPSDCLFARALVCADGSETVPFQVALGPSGTSRVVLGDEVQAWLDYTARVSDTSVFDPLFVHALSYHLAAELVQSLTGEAQKQQNMLKLYEASLAAALTSDGNEGRVTANFSNAFLGARH